MILCDSCQTKSCDKILSYDTLFCDCFTPPLLDVRTGDVVWGRLYAYDTNIGKVISSSQEFRIISLDEDIIRCYSDTSGIAHSFELSEYGIYFFLTEKELLSVYEFDSELR